MVNIEQESKIMIRLETETERSPGLTMTSVKKSVAIKFLMIANKPLLKCIQQRRTISMAVYLTVWICILHNAIVFQHSLLNKNSFTEDEQ